MRKLAGTFVLLQWSLHAFALWPLPTKLKTGSTPIRLASSFDIHVLIENAPHDLKNAIARTKNYINTDKLERLVVGRGDADEEVARSAKTLPSLTLLLDDSTCQIYDPIRSISEEAILPLEEREEGYELLIPDDGKGATLKANTTMGLFRGLTTFEQLWYDSDGMTYALEAPYHILDKPTYPYRGLHLDTSRNYFPVKDIKRTLDAMSWVKINTFHWHVVDSQSFPLVVPGFEEIAKKGAYSRKMVYTPEDVQDIVSYAAARGINVMVEIDVPGHTSAIAKSHPEHIACPEESPWPEHAAEPPSGQLRVASESTTKFTTSLLDAVAKMFPGAYFSTGGDEVNMYCYERDEQTQEELKKQGITIEQAVDMFTQKTHEALRKIGKAPVVWEEIPLEHNIQLGKDALVLVWRNSQHAARATAKGLKVIHAGSNYFYLDCGAGGWLGRFPEGNSWCTFNTWQKAYSFDPLANIPSSQHHLIQGGQSLLWVEQSGPENLDSILWPRAAAAAEVFWSGPGGDGGKALARLNELSFRMRERGVGAISLQPLWCALRPGACDHHPNTSPAFTVQRAGSEL